MDTAAKILAAAKAAFQRRGLEGLSMREIARRVGVTPMAIYRHYGSKQLLVDALVLDALDEWSARVAAIPPAAPLVWFRNIIAEQLEFALRKPRRYEAAFLVHTDKARRYPDDFIAGRSPAGALQLGLIERLMSDGTLKAGPSVDVMIAIAALAQGLITLYRAGRVAGTEAGFRELYLRSTEHCLAAFFREKGR
jgi:AcrR family transcriptional regulator